MEAIILNILAIVVSVSSSVIPDKREVLKHKVMIKKPLENVRVRREIGGASEWIKICPTEEDIVPFEAATDDEGNDILELAMTGNVEYQELVRVERCRDNVAHVGGVTVKCEQEYLEHTIVVYNTDTGQEILQRTFFYPSGCSARVTQPS